MDVNTDKIETIFSGEFMKSWKDYETRPEQVEMAKKVDECLRTSKHLLVEAGTGVGKSLAYLVPALLFSLKEGVPVVISTETRALQQQILNKDIPLLSKILNQPVQAELALGSNNYLCKRRYEQVTSNGNFGIEMENHLREFYDWEDRTETGIRWEYNGFASEEFWGKVTRDPENCLGRKCPNFPHSYYFLEKEKWKKANILVVNHYLLSSHIAGNFKLLPEFSYIIIDEAHSFPEVAGKAFAGKASYSDFTRLFQYISGKDKKASLAYKLFSEALRDKILRLLEETSDKVGQFYQKLKVEFPFLSNASRIKEKPVLDGGELELSLENFVKVLQNTLDSYDANTQILEEQEVILGLDMCIKRFTELHSLIFNFRMMENPNYVFWLEPPSSQDKNNFYSLCTGLISPKDFIQKEFFPRMSSIIFTSATLSSGAGNFNFFCSSVGFQDFESLILESPFPYPENALLYIPKNLHDPGKESEEYHEDLKKLIPMLLKLSGGNAFVLFTSNSSLRNVYEGIVDELEYPVFSQLELGPKKAKEAFLDTPNSVLFGVSTFWQGIDVKGDKLRSVIITRLPFQPPGEPVLEARIELRKQENGNPFQEIQLPHAILSLKQGFGRLIRSKTDTGVVSILDPRIKTKFYGKTILSALPSAKRIFSFKELKKEFENLPKYK
ncbi:MAG: DEAD/DEAH box helicase [Leptospiraceae bacterium]|nr:DEAD/DEAH box helicase [Leptospiraceae bacterium]